MKRLDIFWFMQSNPYESPNAPQEVPKSDPFSRMSRVLGWAVIVPAIYMLLLGNMAAVGPAIFLAQTGSIWGAFATIERTATVVMGCAYALAGISMSIASVTFLRRRFTMGLVWLAIGIVLALVAIPISVWT